LRQVNDRISDITELCAWRIHKYLQIVTLKMSLLIDV
jgi:hypothetical protein